MIEIRVETLIPAAPSRVFDLARSVDLHIKSAAQTGERVVGGRLSGLLELGDEVVFEGRHFGLRFRLHAKITEFSRPVSFADEMVSGPFKSLRHVHHFEEAPPGCRMVDLIRLEAPLGPLGWIAERLLIRGHLTAFLKQRGEFLLRSADDLDELVGV